RQLAFEPDLQIIRRSRRPLLRGLEQARRSAVAHHVYRIASMGARVLINGTRYKQPNREMYAGGPGLASSQHADQGVECVDCHMGAVGQRMTATTAGKAAFDVSFHAMWIAYSGNPPTTLADARGNCEVCHTDQRIMTNGTKPPPKTAAQLLDYVRKIQGSTKAAVTTIQNRAGTNKSKDSKTIL